MSWRATEQEKMQAPRWAHFIGGGSTPSPPLLLLRLALDPSLPSGPVPSSLDSLPIFLNFEL